MWDWLPTHCGKCVTIAAPTFPNLYAAPVTGAVGLGPEIDITLAPIRSRITVRYCRDVVVNARPLGQVLVFGLTIMALR